MSEEKHITQPVDNQPSLDTLKDEFARAGKLIDNVVLKKYLYQLADCEVIPLDDEFKDISRIRLFRVTEMVYRNNEYSTYKFASVFSALQNLNSGVFVILNSNGQKTDFYMGIRAFDEKRSLSPSVSIHTLENTLCGQFPGVRIDNRVDAEKLISGFPSRNIASVTCVANNKNNQFVDNEKFLQGLDKLALSMQGRKYTAVILAKGTSPEQIDEITEAYETIYKNLSPFANMQLSYGYNEAISISESLSLGESHGYSHSESQTQGEGISENKSVSEPDALTSFAKVAGKLAVGIAATAAAPLTGGVSLVAGVAINTASKVALSMIDAVPVKTRTEGTTTSESKTHGETISETKNVSETNTQTNSQTTGSNQNMQLNMQNKKLIDSLETIDTQLKRLKECRDLGMWECAAYFMSDSQQDVEIAAGAYKALMSGENSGVESSAINIWNKKKKKELPLLKDYITNFIHPLFAFNSDNIKVPVSAAAYVSSNELAIHMGLPRNSVNGLPVIEHAQFGKEIVKYTDGDGKAIGLGNVFDMGRTVGSKVDIDIDSLTMHTFVTGSTGSGKSNTIYYILDALRTKHRIPFMVIEPAKGEYKNVFGQFKDVTVYGTNPKLTRLLKINPFSFPESVHVLEHIDRIVELFNVCWPMYAAMPAIMKEAIEKSYVATGWDIDSSENSNGRIFPNFADLFEQIKDILNSSEYSAETKGDYSGALLTRVRSLTTGLNRQIFCSDETGDAELFDKSVIVDLSRVGSTETKSLIMGMLIIKLNEYRMDSEVMNSPLKHICVLEEAHNLLKRTPTEQSSESANLAGKSVELLASSIAEMRTYGEGFIIADQSPGLLDMSVIRNTNTKIVLRLPDKSDRELVGFAAGLKKEQIPELAKLKKGVAAIYQNDWVEPVLCQIYKHSGDEMPYKFDNRENGLTTYEKKFVLLSNILKKFEGERLDLNIHELSEIIIKSNLTSQVKISMMNLFKTNGNCSVENVSPVIYDLIINDKIESEADQADSIEEWADVLVYSEDSLLRELKEKQRNFVIECIIREQINRFDKPIEYLEIWNNYLHEGVK